MRQREVYSEDSRKLAEGEGFEPPVPFRVQRFSRPPPSTARPSLRDWRSVHRADSREVGTFQCNRNGGVDAVARRRDDFSIRPRGSLWVGVTGSRRITPPAPGSRLVLLAGSRPRKRFGDGYAVLPHRCCGADPDAVLREGPPDVAVIARQRRTVGDRLQDAVAHLLVGWA
jgi:hypothetical protein